jgi:microcystin-dependent protein
MSFYDVINSSNYSLYRSNTNQNSLQDNIPPYSMVPVGNVSAFAGITAPVGYFLCDGSAYSRTLYSNLFNVIGTIYGVGDGSSTFNVPNLKGRFPVGLDSSQTEFDNLAETGGAKTHTLTVSEMPSHLHTGTTNSSGAHTHNYQDAYFAENIGGGANNVFGTNGGTDTDNSFYWRTSGGGYSTSPSDIATSSAGAHTHDFTTTTTGGSQPHNNLQPYIVMNYIIKF